MLIFREALPDSQVVSVADSVGICQVCLVIDGQYNGPMARGGNSGRPRG